MKQLVLWKQRYSPSNDHFGLATIWLTPKPENDSWIYCLTSFLICRVSVDISDFLPTGDSSDVTFEAWDGNFYTRTNRLHLIGSFDTVVEMVNLIERIK